MPKIAKVLLQGGNAEAVLKLLNTIQSGARLSFPKLCREMQASFSGKDPRALERSWRKWTSDHLEERTMPTMQALGTVVRVARSKGWLEGVLPGDVQVLIDAVESHRLENNALCRLKLKERMSHASAELATENYQTNGHVEATLEDVLKACGADLAEKILEWSDPSDPQSCERIKKAMDSGIDYVKNKLANAFARVQQLEREHADYTRLIVAGQMPDDSWITRLGDEDQLPIGSNWRKR